MSDLKIRVHDESKGAICEYTANELDDKILNTLWDLWKAPDRNGFLGIGQIINALDENVHVIALRDPSNALLSGLGVPGASFWSSVIQEAPIDTIDKPLGSIGHLIEICGLITGVMSAHPAIAYASLKALIHDEVHRLSVAAIEHLLASDYSVSSYGDELPFSRAHTVHDVDPSIRSIMNERVAAETARAERKRANAAYLDQMEQVRAARAARKRAETKRADR